MSDNNLPKDVQKRWYNVVRRMQSVAKSEGLSIVTVKVLVKSDGTPISWNVDSHILEPKSLQQALLDVIEEGKNIDEFAQL